MTREQAISYFHEFMDNEPILIPKLEKAMQVAIKALEQESRWIPVSERLPEPKARDGLIARYYLMQNEYGDMLVARYDGKGWEQMYQHKYLEDEVIAWMPLPKAYREVEE